MEITRTPIKDRFKGKVAIVTGGSFGIGKAVVEELCREGAMAYIDTIGTKADEKTYKRLRLLLESSHRAVHNRMHQLGHFHRHSPLTNHPGHNT